MAEGQLQQQKRLQRARRNPKEREKVVSKVDSINKGMYKRKGTLILYQH
jgi:hypothetical protein